MDSYWFISRRNLGTTSCMERWTWREATQGVLLWGKTNLGHHVDPGFNPGSHLTCYVTSGKSLLGTSSAHP